MEGKVGAVCLGKMKGEPKQELPEICLMRGVGVIGDAHAGTKQEISLLAREDVDALCQKTGIKAPPGSFAENISTRGIVLALDTDGYQIAWEQATDEAIYTSPILASGLLLVTPAQGEVLMQTYVVETGVPQWQFIPNPTEK